MKTMKKLLSVVLALTMIISSVSVCFSSLAASGTVTADQWNALMNALKSNTVAAATFSGTANNYEVADPDGDVLKAVEAYWSVFTTLADKEPSSSSAGNRTINQVNATIMNHLKSNMGAAYTTYNTEAFIKGLLCGANVSSNRGSQLDSAKNDTTVPGTNLSAVADVNLTVTFGKALMNYDTLEDLPPEVPTSKTFTVKHTNTKYDSSSETKQETEGSGCNATTVNNTYYHYWYYYAISSATTKDGETMSTATLKSYETTLKANADYFSTDMKSLVAKGSTNLTAAKKAINEAYDSFLEAFNDDTDLWKHFYKAYDVAAATKRINTALSIINYAEIAEEIETLAATDYSKYTTSQLVSLYNSLDSKIDAYDLAADDVKAYIATNYGFDLAAAKAELVKIDRERQLSQIRDFKVEVDKDIATYSAYDEEGIDAGTVTSAMITAAISDLNANITSLNNNYKPEYVVEVCGEGYLSSLQALVARLTDLGKVAGYNEEFIAEYNKFAQQIKPVTNTSANSTDLRTALQNYDSWYEGLKSLIDEMRTELGNDLADALFDDLNDEMTGHMDLAYEALKSRVEAQVNTADDLYTSIKKQYGDVGVTLPSLKNYELLKNTIGLIDVESYNFINTTSHIDFASETIDKYNALQKIVLAYDEFVASFGFSNFVSSELDYPTRNESDKDIAREDDYEVTEDRLLETIEALDKIITSDVVGSILGGGEEDVSLGSMLSELLEGVIFSDSFINTVVQMLYPLVLGEFIKVFATLPSSAAGVSVKYNKNLHDTANALSFEIFPDLLANVLDSGKYPDNVAMLKAAVNNFDTEFGNSDGKKYTTKLDPVENKIVPDKTPWDSSELVDEEGKLKLVWGVDAAKEAGKSGAEVASAFYQAFDDAVEGIKPLLLALLANKEWSPSTVSGFATADLLWGVGVDLELGASANSGYANTLVPIYEALGVSYTSVSTVEGTYANSANQAADILKAILDPIFAFVDKIGEKPVDTILSILPNLCYALSTGMVTPLLDMLKTTIDYHALAIGFLDVKNDTVNISVGSMLNLEDLGIDLSGGINTLLTSFGLALPEIDQETVATLGELKQINTTRKEYIYTAPAGGKAYHINADKAGVGYYLLNYILQLVKDEEALTGLLGAFMTLKDENGEAITDEEGNTFPDTEAIAEITKLIYEDLKLNEMNVGDAIAAIVELANQIEYDTLEDYKWYDGTVGGTVEGMTPATQVYLSYSNNWSKSTADYVVENLETILTSVLTMAGVELDLGQTIGDLIGGLLTNANMTALAKELADLEDLIAGLMSGETETDETTPDENGDVATVEETEGGEGEAEAAPAIDIVALIKDAAEIDLGAFAQYKELADDYNWGFEDGDSAGFIREFVKLLAPFAPAIDFLLEGADLQLIKEGDDAALTIIGYNGYNNAIIPLLEALGCDAKALDENDDALTVTLTAIADRLEAIADDPINEILDIVPGVIYFIASNGLTTAVRNLLQPVYVLLDTIRPIYDVNLGELIGGLTQELGVVINLDNLGVDFVLDLVRVLAGLDLSELGTVIYDVCKVIGVDYESASTLIGEKGKKGAYTEGVFDKADMVTVVVSFLLDWLKNKDNAAAFDALVKMEGLSTSLVAFMEGVEPTIEKINWMYYFGEDHDFTDYDFSSGVSIPPSILSVTYPNDWTEESAEYIDENLDELISTVLGLTGSEYTDLGSMLSDNVNIYTTENVQAIAGVIQKLLADIDATLLEAVGVLLDADLAALMAYTAPEGIDTADEFVSALVDLLGTVPTLVEWLFLGEDIAFFTDAKGDAENGYTADGDLITINGSEGYKKGLAPVLEAIGVENLPDGTEDNVVELVLKATFARLDEILADPVNEVFDILPNVIYFINADGLSASVHNTLSAVYALLEQLKAFGLELSISELLGFNLEELTFETIIALIEKETGLDLSDVEELLSGLCVGTIKSYNSLSGEYAYKMVYDSDMARHDMITILVTVALITLSDEGNAAKLDELMGTDIISALGEVFASAPVIYNSPDWDYCLDGDDQIDNTIGVIENALEYPNDWTEDTAKYLTDNLAYFVDYIIALVGIKNADGESYTSLSGLIADKVDIYTGENIEAITKAVTDILKDIDATLIETAGILLDADLAGLAEYKAPAGIDTAEEFSAELANVLVTYANGVVEWLLLGENYAFFVDDANADGKYAEGEDIITINGGHGYAEGLALILEAIGCENLPDAYETQLTTEEFINAVLTSAFARVDEILANPVDEVFALLPNLLYFLNANGVAVAVDNLLGAFNALATKLSVFGVSLDLNQLINIEKLLGIEEDLSIGLDNLTVAALLELATYMTGLDLTILEDVLVGFALGRVATYDSVSRHGITYKMYYDDEFAKYDMVTVIATAALLVIENEENAKVLDELIGKETISALTDIFKGAAIEYTTPDWDYCFDPDDMEGDTIGVMDSALTYPNDWTKESSQYVVDNLDYLDGLVAGLIDENYSSLGDLLDDKVNIYSSENVQAIVDAIAGLLGNIDGKLLDLAGLLLGADIAGLVSYKAPEGIDTAEEFADEITNVLVNYAGGVVDWLLLGRNYEFFVAEDANKDGKYDEDIITITGAHGYAEGLALLLEAIGCENLPDAYDSTLTTEEIVNGALTSLFTRVDEILADPVNEVIDLLPNVLYFLNANGVAAVIDNLLAALNALLDKLAVLGLELDIEALINIEELLGLKDENGNVPDLAISTDNLTVAAILEVASFTTGLDLTVLEDVLVGFALGSVVEYDSISKNAQTYKMIYADDIFAKRDMITVLVTAVLLVVETGDNAEKLDKLMGTDIISALDTVFESTPVTYSTPDWDYCLDGDDTVGNTIGVIESALTYPNDWTEESAQYVADNLEYIGNMIANVIDKNYTNLGELVSDKVVIYSSENIQAIVNAIAGVISNIDAKLIEAAGVLLDVDLAGLKSYKAPAGIDNADEFAAELTNVLTTYANGAVEWLLLGQDFEFFVDDDRDGKYEDGEAIITINGGHGYAEGLALILEAIGCEDLPEAYDTTETTEEIVNGVLTSLFARVDEILANPVVEVVDILPNVLYFLNANGFAAAIDNLLGAVNALLLKLKVFGIELDVEALINIEELLGLKDENGNVPDLAISTDNLTLAAILEVVSFMTGLDLTVLEGTLVNFALGRVAVSEDSVSRYAKTYKMYYHDKFAKRDMITVIATAVLLVIENEDNAAALDKLLGTNIISALRTIFSSALVEYATPDWGYCLDENDKESNTIGVMDSALTYPNDWTEDSAQYVVDNLEYFDGLLAGLIDKNYTSLGALVSDKVTIYSGENIQAIVNAIAGLLDNIDAKLLEAAGILLNVDLAGLKAYKAPAGIDTAEEFADELTNVLVKYAYGVVEWLLLGRDYAFFVNDADGNGEYVEGEDIITINGGHGYAEGLALVLEAIGCENLPEAYDTTETTEEIINGVLTSLFARVDEILANPLVEVVDLLPNLLYFLNANGVAIAVDNLLAAVKALVAKLSVLGVSLDIESLINIEEILGLKDENGNVPDLAISTDNLTVAAILEVASFMTGLDLTVLEDVLVGFALGRVATYDSVSRHGITYKMYYDDEFAKRDMITVIATAVLLTVENEANAEKLDKLLGTNIVSALKTIFASALVKYETPDWDYCLDNSDVVNNTIGVMEYAITYPNNWTEESAQYVVDNLREFGDMIAGLIDGNYTSLSALVGDKLTIYSTENVQAIVDMITGLLGDIDSTLLEGAGILLDIDLVGLKAYKAPAGIDTAEEFADELTKVLTTYAKGVVEWLLLGRNYAFFVDDANADGKYVEGEDIITINGGHGYAEGLALVLEAIGCEDLPEAYDTTETTEEIVNGVLTSLFARVDEILADPVVEIFDLLPNLLYFLNANGLATVVDNLLAAVKALVEKLSVLGINLDIESLVNIEKLLGIEEDLAISLDNLTMAAVLEVVSVKTGLDLAILEDVLVGFALGRVEVNNDSVSRHSKTYKMYYHDEFAKRDMVTVIANAVLLTVKDEDNAAKLKELLGEDIYDVVLNIFNMKEVPVQEIDWKFTEHADTDYVFSAISTSDLYKGFTYGPLYTEEMAQYIADNIGTFIDNIVYLLGINIDGVSIDNLKELINALINGSLYNSKNVIAIRDFLAGKLSGIANMTGGKHIVAILKTSLGVDLNAIATVQVPEFDNNRDMFVEYLCDVIEPIYPILRWALCDEDFTFFVNEEKNDLITLTGGEGYVYGIIPLLETLDCEDILAPEAYYAAVNADKDAVITTVLDPLLDRVDVIMNNPADEILGMLPNLIYFINSNGLDTVFKNTLNAVYTLLNAIEPIAKIDLYDVLGIRLDDVTFETLFDLALELIAEKTGYEFSALDASAVVELSVGKLVSYKSLNGKTAYRMIYQSEGAKAEMVTVVMRLAITFIMHENNREMLVGVLRDNLGMSADAEKYLRGVLDGLATYAINTHHGMDSALAMIYYLFYGSDIMADGAADGHKDINAKWQKILKNLSNSNNPMASAVGDLVANILDLTFDDIFDSEGLAPNGFISFFQKLKDWFNSIMEWFKNLFN